MQTNGQAYLEYALLIVLVAIIVLVILVLLGPAIGNMFSNIVTNI
jgi:pilus assembly protein Flp/PilA